MNQKGANLVDIFYFTAKVFVVFSDQRCEKRNEREGEDTASFMYILFSLVVIPKVVYLGCVCVCVCVRGGARHSVSSGLHSVDPALYSPPTMGEAWQLQHVAALC